MYISAIKVNITHSYTDGITASASGAQHSWAPTEWTMGERDLTMGYAFKSSDHKGPLTLTVSDCCPQ